jgi:hypothetical protein
MRVDTLAKTIAADILAERQTVTRSRAASCAAAPTRRAS